MDTESNDVDALAQAARSGESPDAMNALWRAVYALEHWHYVGRGEVPNLHPFIDIVNGQPFLMAFTDARRARAYAVRKQLGTSTGAFPMLRTPVIGAVVMADSMEKQGVFGILFNDGAHRFVAPLSKLAIMYEHHLDELPAELWKPFVKGVRAANHPQARQRLLRRLGLLEKWFALKTPAGEVVTADIGRRAHVLLFTDEPHVQLGLKRIPPETARTLIMTSTPPQQAAPTLISTFKPQGVDQVCFNLGGESVTGELDDLERAVAAASTG